MPDLRERSLVLYCTWEEDGEFKASLGYIRSCRQTLATKSIIGQSRYIVCSRLALAS